MKELTEYPPTSSPAQPLSSNPVDFDPGATTTDKHEPPEVRAAKELARRYRLTFVELLPTEGESPVDFELFQAIPVDMMVRHLFLPLKKDEKGLHLAMADPTDLERLDELSGSLRARIVPY